MTPDPAATMRQRYGEREGKTCGECFWFNTINKITRCWYVTIGISCKTVRKRDAACGKFEAREVEK